MSSTGFFLGWEIQINGSATINGIGTDCIVVFLQEEAYQQRTDESQPEKE